MEAVETCMRQLQSHTLVEVRHHPISVFLESFELGYRSGSHKADSPRLDATGELRENQGEEENYHNLFAFIERCKLLQAVDDCSGL
jgi:hypothetical protein